MEPGAILIIGLINSVIFGIITQKINSAKGYAGGFWWGFWLGPIGIIVVACRAGSSAYFFNEEAADKKIITDGGWKCNKCGRTNPSYTGT